MKRMVVSVVALISVPGVTGSAGVVVADLLGEREGKGRRRNWHVMLIPVGAYVAWQMLLLHTWGQAPVLAGDGNVGLPLQGLDTALILWIGARLGDYISQPVLVVAFASSVVFSFRSTGAQSGIKLSWLLYGSLALSLTALVWTFDAAFSRALTEFYVLGALIIVGAEQAPRRYLSAGILAFWVALVLRHLVADVFGPWYQL